MLDIKNPIHKLIRRFLQYMLPKDSKMKGWLGIIDMSIMEIAQKLVSEMDEAGIDISTPLMMDMAYCKKFGGGAKRFEDQMTETLKAVESINRHYNRIRMLPFIAADPNRKNVADLVRDVLDGGVFVGVKIYPVMGFTPDDKRLYPIYEYCVQKNIPVTAHCENGGIPGLSEFYYLADPKYWGEVLRDFPTLTLNLAHNDRTGSSWQPKIMQLIIDYPNVYTDISYDTEMWVMPRRYFKSIKRMLQTPKVQDRVLYGTDWYMGRYLWTEASYLRWFSEYSKKISWCRVKFTDGEMDRLTDYNPRAFLGLTEDHSCPKTILPRSRKAR